MTARGRPKGSTKPEALRRTRKVQGYATPAEVTELDAAALEAGKSRSAYVVDVALDVARGNVGRKLSISRDFGRFSEGSEVFDLDAVLDEIPADEARTYDDVGAEAYRQGYLNGVHDVLDGEAVEKDPRRGLRSELDAVRCWLIDNEARLRSTDALDRSDALGKVLDAISELDDDDSDPARATVRPG